MTQVDLGHYEFWLWKCSLFFEKCIKIMIIMIEKWR